MFRAKARPACRAWFSCLLVLCAAVRSHAQVPAVPPEQRADVREARQSGARQHFDRALELYRAGKYAEARDELKAAAQLDPDGKDLFFNLALVEEKLGNLDAAIAALERFLSLESDATERARARVTIDRLRGAQRAAALAQAAPAPCPQPAPGPSAVLIGSATLAVVSLVVGAVFGAKALQDDVAGEPTSTSLSVAQLRERARRAEREALVADVAFAVAAASAGTFACVWLLAPSNEAARSAGFAIKGRF